MSLKIDSRVLRKYRTLGDGPIGRGSYGTVWKAERAGSEGRERAGRLWALKKCHDPFRNAHDAQGMFREVMILRALRHDNIVRLKEVLRDSADKDLYIIFEFIDTTVEKIIQSGQLQEKHRSCIMYQLLNAVQYLHSAELVHRDLKPANLLIDSVCRLRVADFGEARSLVGGLPAAESADDRLGASAGAGALAVGEDLAGGMTECGFTLWYNAPEVIVGSSTYGKPVDLWACGCVCGELLGKHRRALFMGSSQVDQLSKYVNLVGLPNGEKDIDSLDSRHAHDMMRSVPRHRENRIQKCGLFVDQPDGIALMSRLLVFPPSQRTPARELLIHPFLAQYHDPAREEPRKEPVLVEFEGQAKLSAAQYRDALYTRLNLGGSTAMSVGNSQGGTSLSHSAAGSPGPFGFGDSVDNIRTASVRDSRGRSQQRGQDPQQGAARSQERQDSVTDPLLANSRQASRNSRGGGKARGAAGDGAADDGDGCCCVAQ